ncbi:hypothetical protein FH972_008845 [Carpinus fangiana]|uniref:Uncharacterized protein n=1 Tax=Carpinus fangiana TaxID=176857 RepID=A0A5N6R1J8_9ROSI|nr:hypothetical protein FH972_008845 [Carpinus fangiana]
MRAGSGRDDGRQQRLQESSQEIAPTRGDSDDSVLDGSGVYVSVSSIGVGCNGGQLTSPDRMVEKTMAAVCRDSAVRQGEYGKGDGQPGQCS